jgi:hypothetical protein
VKTVVNHSLPRAYAQEKTFAEKRQSGGKKTKIASLKEEKADPRRASSKNVLAASSFKALGFFALLRPCIFWILRGAFGVILK